jgi:hypothetical protein
VEKSTSRFTGESHYGDHTTCRDGSAELEECPTFTVASGTSARPRHTLLVGHDETGHVLGDVAHAALCWGTDHGRERPSPTLQRWPPSIVPQEPHA